MLQHLRIGAAIAILVALPACTSQAPAGGMATASAGGKTCIRTQLIHKQTVLSDQDIKFEMGNGDVYVNHLPTRCPGLKMEGSFAWELHNGEACSNQEIIHVLNGGGTCVVGAFVKQPST